MQASIPDLWQLCLLALHGSRVDLSLTYERGVLSELQRPPERLHLVLLVDLSQVLGRSLRDMVGPKPTLEHCPSRNLAYLSLRQLRDADL